MTMRSLSLLPRLILTVLLLTTASAHAQNVIQNPSFEAPVLATAYAALVTGQDIGGVWFVTQHVSDVGHVRHSASFNNVEPYPDGDQMVYVGDSGDAGKLAQPISTSLVAGNYRLSFFQGILNLNQVAEVRIELAPITGGSGFGTTYGAPVYSQLFNEGGPGVPPAWVLQTETIAVPSTGAYGLILIGAQDGLPSLVDNVSLSFVPEPCAAALAAMAPISLALLTRRRHRRA